MKNVTFLLFLFFLNLYFPQPRAQVYSDAPISISDNKETLTDMLYIKFKTNDIIKIPSGEVKTNGSSISDSYPGIKEFNNKLL